MTWSVFTQAADKRGGSAELRYRLKIAGLPYEGVSHVEMARAATWSSNQPERLHGLVIRGQKIGYKADFLTGKLQGQGLTVGFVDLQNSTRKNTWSYLFNRQASQVTWLAADLAVGDTTVTVASTAGFSSSGMIWVDGEAIYYEAKGGGGTTYTTCHRGWFGTQAAAHYNGTGAGLRSPEVTDWPQLIEGRRAYLYAYADGDDVQGDGTLIWQGITLGEPSFNGVQWTLMIDPLTSILKQNVGSAILGNMKPRGIIYPTTSTGPGSFGFDMSWTQSATTAVSVSGTFYSLSNNSVTISGFYETQEDFCIAVNTAIATVNTAVGGFKGTLTAVSDGASGWHLEYTTDAADPRGLYINVRSRLDGTFGDGGFPQQRYIASGGSGVVYSTVGACSVGGSTFYYMPNPDPTGAVASVPRGALYPGGKVYLNTAFQFPAGATPGTMLVAWQAIPTLQNEMTGTVQVASTSATERSVTTGDSVYTFSGLEAGFMPWPWHMWLADSLPTFRVGISLDSALTPGTPGSLPGNSLYNFLSNIWTLGPTLWNLGILPQVISSDFDYVAWQALNYGPSLVSSRTYSCWAPHTLDEYITPELMLAGYFLTVNSSGQLSIKPMRLPASSEVSGATAITSSDILNDSEKLTFERGGMSLCNSATLQIGYDPVKDDWTGMTYDVRNVAAFSQAISDRTIEVKPLSGYTGPPITPEDVQNALSTVLGVLGQSYSVVTMDVSARLWDIAIGDPVSITYALMPADDGTQGVTRKVGIVIGWEAETYSPRVRLTILTTMQRLGGYAPAAIITAQSNTAGTTWSLTLDTGFCPSGTDITTFFAASDRITVTRYDNATASRVAGTVSSVTSSSMVVVLDGAWVPAGSSWYVTIADADDASLASGQKVYVHEADSSKHVNYASGDVPAWRFGA